MANLFASYVLEQLSGAALAADPATKLALAELNGKRLRLVCTLPPVEATLRITHQGLEIEPDATSGERPAPAHALVRGAATDLLSLLGGGSTSKLQIEGDLQFLQRLTEILKGYRPALPELPAGAGPLPPQMRHDAQTLLNNGFGAAAEGLSLLSAAMGAGRRQFASELSDQFTREPDMDMFLDRLHELRLRVDRLQARLNRLGSP